MTASAHDSPVTLDLTLSQRWVLHAALLGYLETETETETDAGRPAEDALALLDALEATARTEFSESDLRLARGVLVEYLADAPLRDRADCREVLSGIRGALP